MVSDALPQIMSHICLEIIHLTINPIWWFACLRFPRNGCIPTVETSRISTSNGFSLRAPFFFSSLWINAASRGFIPVCRREEVFVLITWDQRERLVIEHAKTVWMQYLNAHNMNPMNLSRCCAHWESLLYASSSGDFGWRLSLGGHVVFEWLEFWTFTKFKGFLPMLFCHELLHHFFLSTHKVFRQVERRQQDSHAFWARNSEHFGKWSDELFVESEVRWAESSPSEFNTKYGMARISDICVLESTEPKSDSTWWHEISKSLNHQEMWGNMLNVESIRPKYELNEIWKEWNWGLT